MFVGAPLSLCRHDPLLERADALAVARDEPRLGDPGELRHDACLLDLALAADEGSSLPDAASSVRVPADEAAGVASRNADAVPTAEPIDPRFNSPRSSSIGSLRASARRDGLDRAARAGEGGRTRAGVRVRRRRGMRAVKYESATLRSVDVLGLGEDLGQLHELDGGGIQRGCDRGAHPCPAKGALLRIASRAGGRSADAAARGSAVNLVCR
jgi:hypothetical protein